jgi:hypothetical protein
MSFKYEFQKTCFAKKLEQEIRSSSIVTALDYITVVIGVKTEVWFKAELSNTDEQTLQEIIQNHNEEPTQEAQLVILDHPKDVNGRLVITNSPFSDSSGFRFRGASFKFNATANSETVYDYPLTEERFVHGGMLIVDNVGEDDKATFEVVDKDNIFGFGAGAVLDRFIDSFYIPKNESLEVALAYPARLIAGLYLRCKYTSTHASGAIIKCNLYLHKKS